MKTDPLLGGARGSERLLELAREHAGALHRGAIGYFAEADRLGHKGDFTTCPQSDCLLVRGSSEPQCINCRRVGNSNHWAAGGNVGPFCQVCVTAVRELVPVPPNPEIEAFWQGVQRGWDIEPREYFDREAPKNGFKFPIAQALHHIWKRCVKENPPFLVAAPAPSAPQLGSNLPAASGLSPSAETQSTK